MEVLETNRVNVSLIDEDYQMIDAYIDKTLKKKILNFEYVDFCKLVSCNRVAHEDEQQRLEIINRNGMSYLAPVADRDIIQISNYSRWEQAFRVFSNVLTARYPHKATELLQYNHTIHTVLVSYVWENVYSYDREF